MTEKQISISVVIPCFKVRSYIMDVLKKIGHEIRYIYVIDDKCPQDTGRFVSEKVNDSRIKIIFNDKNKGVGGAVIEGYKAALNDGADIIVKLDGDGQMDPEMIPRLVKPIIDGKADYAKGNRFFDLNCFLKMPFPRFLGNILLSFLTKLSSGYWNIFDPTNGFTAIHSNVLKNLPLEKISNNYFFESDMLFHLYMMRAVIKDVSMNAIYKGEESSLVISKIFFPFIIKHFNNTVKRIFYSYYLHNFNFASIELFLSIIFLIGGITFGTIRWWESFSTGYVSSSGTVMLAALPIILGIQFLLGFLNFDLQNIPKEPLHIYI